MEEVCTLLHFNNQINIPMKKLHLLIICLTFFCTIKSQINEPTHYVSELFEHILSNTIQANLDTKSINNIYNTHNQNLYVVNRKGFANQTQNGTAKVLKFNTITGTVETCLIAPPPKYMESEKNTNHIWIWAIAATDSLLFIAVDEEIWTYQLTYSKQYEYLKSIVIEGVSRLETDGKNLHAFVDDDEGFDWFKITLTNYEMKKIRKLTLTNRFFLQIAPVQVISIKNNALYLLQQNEPAIEKYSLTGNLLAKYRLKIPDWNCIPKEATQKLDSIKDITERNYAFPKFSVFDYNFMFLFYVFPSERFFMMALDRNKSADGFAAPYFVQIIGDTTIIEPFSVRLNENEKFGTKYFPFLTPRAEENIIYAHSNEFVIQINRRTNVAWNNKTHKEFQHDVNLYYRDNEPVEKIETYRFRKNYIPVDSVQFLDYDDNIFHLKDIKTEKAIFIISQYPQCSACIKAIWHFFSKKQLPNIDLYCVVADSPTYLIKKENIKEVNTYLKTEYTPLFFNTKKLNPATKRLLTQNANPIIVLFDKKLQHIEAISANHIISDFTGSLSPSFIHTIDNFIGK